MQNDNPAANLRRFWLRTLGLLHLCITTSDQEGKFVIVIKIKVEKVEFMRFAQLTSSNALRKL